MPPGFPLPCAEASPPNGNIVSSEIAVTKYAPGRNMEHLLNRNGFAEGEVVQSVDLLWAPLM